MRRAALEGGGQRGGGGGSSVGRAPGAGPGQLEGGPLPRAGGRDRAGAAGVPARGGARRGSGWQPRGASAGGGTAAPVGASSPRPALPADVEGRSQGQ
eukprot:10264964-Lingulodinium_polyedra.AAC.1